MIFFKKTYFFLFILLIAIDQGSKYIIRHQGGFYICNQGIAFGISGIFLYFLLLIGVAFLFWQRNKIREVFLDLPMLFVIIIASGASNLIDRIIFGCVIDFIDMKIWPIFNLADVFIFISAIILLLKILKEGKNV